MIIRHWTLKAAIISFPLNPPLRGKRPPRELSHELSLLALRSRLTACLRQKGRASGNRDASFQATGDSLAGLLLAESEVCCLAAGCHALDVYGSLRFLCYLYHVLRLADGLVVHVEDYEAL